MPIVGGLDGAAGGVNHKPGSVTVAVIGQSNLRVGLGQGTRADSNNQGKQERLVFTNLSAGRWLRLERSVERNRFLTY